MNFRSINNLQWFQRRRSLFTLKKKKKKKRSLFESQHCHLKWVNVWKKKKITSTYNFFELLTSFSLFEFLEYGASFSIFEFLSFIFNTIYKSYYILFINLIVLFYNVNVSYYTIQLTFNFIFICSAKSQFQLNIFLPNGQTICFLHTTKIH